MEVKSLVIARSIMDTPGFYGVRKILPKRQMMPISIKDLKTREAVYRQEGSSTLVANREEENAKELLRR